MKRIILLLIITIVLLSGCSSNKLRPVDKLKYPPLNDVKIPDVQTATLSNGMKVYFLVDNKIPIINIDAQAHSGSITDPADKIGLAELASNSISFSSKKYSAEELKDILNDNGISLYSYTTSRHSKVEMNYLSEDTDLAMNIFADILTNPTFDADEFETLKTRTLSSIYRRNDDITSLTFREFRKIIYGQDYPLVNQEEIYSINNITLEDVQAFYSEYYYPKNITLTVSGDFDIAEMTRLLEYHFATWSSPLEYKNITIPEPNPNIKSKVFVINKPDASQTWVMIGHISNLLIKDEDYPAMELLNTIIGGGFNSRVFKSVRVEKGYSYSPSAFLYASFADPGAFYLTAPTATENTLKVAQALVEEVRIITQEKVTKEELEYAKDSYFNSFVFKYEKPEYTLSAIKNCDYFGYDRNISNIIKDKIEDVTVDDIFRVAKKYLKPDELVYLFVGNKDEFIDDVASIGKVEEIDISIKESLKGEVLDYAKGKEIFFKFLNKAKSKKQITSLSTSSVITSATPMGDLKMDKTTHIIFPDKISDSINSPMGKVATIISNGEGVQMVPGRNVPLDQSQLTSIIDQINFSYFGWLNDVSKLKIGYLQDELIDEVEYQVLNLEFKEKNMKLWINKETNLPAFSIENMESAQGMLRVKSSFEDYQPNGLVICPMKVVTTLIDGTPINTMTYKEIKFNSEIPAEKFDF